MLHNLRIHVISSHLPQDLNHERSEIILPPQWNALGLGLLGIENRFFAIFGGGFMKKNFLFTVQCKESILN